MPGSRRDAVRLRVALAIRGAAMSPRQPDVERERTAILWRRRNPEASHASEPHGPTMADPPDAEPEVTETVHPREAWEHTP